MCRRRIMATAGGVCVLAGAVGVLAAASRPTPLWRTVPIGSLSTLAVDSRLSRAFILDDGDLTQHVTVMGNGGYSWSGGSATAASTAKVRILDTRTGRLIKSLDAPQSAQELVVDAPTGRVFVFDQGQVEVIDARHGKLLATVLYGGDLGLQAPNLAPVAAVVDDRSGHLCVALDEEGASVPSARHLLLLDGRSGRTLRVVTFSPGRSIAVRLPNGAPIRYPPALSLALDQRTGHLYVFTGDRRMRVLDMGSGRLLTTRRLPLALTDPVVDERSQRVFALAWAPGAAVAAAHGGGPPATAVLLDPGRGIIKRLRPVGAFWPYLSFNNSHVLGLDAASGHVFLLDLNRSGRDAVDVLDATGGRLVRSVALTGTPYGLLLDGPHHRVLVQMEVQGTRETAIAVVDTRSGALSRTIELGHAAYPLALDTRSGHVVTAYNTMSNGVPDRWNWLPRQLRARLPGVPPPPLALLPNERILTHTALTLDPAPETP